MCDQTEVAYLPDDVVWVKLGNVWWPGQVQDQDTLDDDITRGLKKKPLAVVKFFDEAYEYVRNLDQIYHYNCLKKTDFIRKGLDQCRSKDASTTMKKFPEDIARAERLTGGDPNIVHDPKFLPEKKFDYTELFNIKKGSPRGGTRGRRGRRRSLPTTPGPSKSPRGRPPTRNLQTPPAAPPQTPRPITNPRLIQKVLTGTSDYESNIRVQLTPAPDEADIKTYTCSICGYSTTRINVLILHNKAHMGGYSWPIGDTPRATSTPRLSASPATPKPDSRAKGVKRKNEEVDSTPTTTKRNNVTPPKKTPKKRGAKSKEEKAAIIKKKNEAIRDKLLEDWEEEDPNEEQREIEKLRQSVSTASSLSEPPPPSPHKSCFDFVDNEDSIDVNRSLKFGQKLPRVISGEKSKKKTVEEIKQSLREQSQDRHNSSVDESDTAPLEHPTSSDAEKEDTPGKQEETPETNENDTVVEPPETTGIELEKTVDKKEEENNIDEKERKVTETLDSEFETLLKETSVPVVPDLPTKEEASKLQALELTSEDTPLKEVNEDLENESEVLESKTEDDSHPDQELEASPDLHESAPPEPQLEEGEKQIDLKDHPEKKEENESRMEEDSNEQLEQKECQMRPEPEEPQETIQQEETLKSEEMTVQEEEVVPMEQEEEHSVSNEQEILEEEQRSPVHNEPEQQTLGPEGTEEGRKSPEPISIDEEIQFSVEKPSDDTNIPQDIEIESIVETEISVAEESVVSETFETITDASEVEITTKDSVDTCDAVDGVTESAVVPSENEHDPLASENLEKIETETVNNSIITEDTPLASPRLDELPTESQPSSAAPATSATASDVPTTVETESSDVPDVPEDTKDSSGTVVEIKVASEKDVVVSTIDTDEHGDAKLTEDGNKEEAQSNQLATVEQSIVQKSEVNLEDDSKKVEPIAKDPPVEKMDTTPSSNDVTNSESVKALADMQQMDLDIRSMPIVLGEDIIGDPDVKQSLLFCTPETVVQNNPQTITKLRVELRPPGETDVQKNQQVITIPGKSPVKTQPSSFAIQKKTQSSKVKAASNIVPQKGPGGASQVVIVKTQSPGGTPSKFTIGKNTVQKLSTGQIQLASGQQVVTASQQVLTSGQLSGKVLIFPSSGGSNKIVTMTTQQHKTLAPATLAVTTAKLQTVPGTRIVTKAQPNNASSIAVNKQNQKMLINKGDVGTTKNVLLGKAQTTTGVKSSQSILSKGTVQNVVVGKPTPPKSVIITTIPKTTVAAQKPQPAKPKTKLVVQSKTKTAPVSSASQVKVVSKVGQPANTVYIQTTQGLFQATSTPTLVQRQQQQQPSALQKRLQSPMKARQASPNILQRSQRKAAAAVTTAAQRQVTAAAMPAVTKQQFLTIPSAAIHAGDIILTTSGDSVVLAGKQESPAVAPSSAPVKMLYLAMDEHGNYRQLDDSLITLEGTGGVGNADGTLYIDAGTGAAADADNIFLSIDASGNVINISHDETGRPPQDILAKALADTQVLQSEAAPVHVEPQLFLTQSHAQAGSLPSLSHNVLETSLTLNQPIMTPLEVPSVVAPSPAKDELGPSMPLLTDELEDRGAGSAPAPAGGAPASELGFRLTLDCSDDALATDAASLKFRTTEGEGVFDADKTSRKEFVNAGDVVQQVETEHPAQRNAAPDFLNEIGEGQTNGETTSAATLDTYPQAASWESDTKPVQDVTNEAVSTTLKRPAEQEHDPETVKRSRSDADDCR